MKRDNSADGRAYLTGDNMRRPYDFDSVLNTSGSPAETFFELTRRLRESFHINRGVLVVKRAGTGELAAVSTWNNGRAREGLTISLPKAASLFDKVAENGRVYTEDYCGSFSGNFFERKLLLDDSSRSFVLHPLKSDGKVVGLLGYSSDQPTAFTVFEEGALDEVVNRLATVVRKRA